MHSCRSAPGGAGGQTWPVESQWPFGTPWLWPHRRLRVVFGAALLAGAVLLVLAARFFSSDIQCEAGTGDSNYGKAEWSWMPVGTRCHWTERVNRFDRVEDASWGPTIIVAGMVVLGLTVLVTSRPRPSDRT